MSSETAYAKLSWILARTRDLEEVRRLVATPMAFELSERTEPINYCLGGVS